MTFIFEFLCGLGWTKHPLDLWIGLLDLQVWLTIPPLTLMYVARLVSTEQFILTLKLTRLLCLLLPYLFRDHSIQLYYV